MNALLINGEEYNLKKIVCCEGGLQLEDIETQNFTEDELNTRL